MRFDSMRTSSIVFALAASAFAAPLAEPQVVSLSVLTTNSLGATVTSLLAAVTTSTPTTSSTSTTSSKKTTSATSKKTTTTTSKKTTSTTSKKTTSTTSSKKSTSTTFSTPSTQPLTPSTTPLTPSTAPLTPSTTVAASATAVNSPVGGTPVVNSRTATLAPGAIPTTFSQIALYHHNIHRANHSAPDLVWSDSLANIAANIASSCVYMHNTAAGGGGYGQNIAAGVEANNVSRVITDLFYNGEMPLYADYYGIATPNFTDFVHWGHFSQVVWKQTSMIGCAVQYCPGGLSNTPSNVAPYFTVCNYGPPGNYIGEFGDNVGAPLGNPSADWSTGLNVTELVDGLVGNL